MFRFNLTFFSLSFFCLVLSEQAPAVAWGDPHDAIQKLWGARLKKKKSLWPIKYCDKIKKLHRSTLKVVSHNPLNEDHLVIPFVSVKSHMLTDYLKHMATTLLNYKSKLREVSTPGTWLPKAYPDDGPIDMDLKFWKTHTRSTHENDRNVLPDPATVSLENTDALFEGLQNDAVRYPSYCPDNLPSGRPNKMVILQSHDGLTNQQKWHCYASQNIISGVLRGAPGFVEITHYEHESPEVNQYSSARSLGRLVYDYVNGRLYYSPMHYSQWSKGISGQAAKFRIDGAGKNKCLKKGTCCTSFFELVK